MGFSACLLKLHVKIKDNGWLVKSWHLWQLHEEEALCVHDENNVAIFILPAPPPPTTAIIYFHMNIERMLLPGLYNYPKNVCKIRTSNSKKLLRSSVEKMLYARQAHADTSFSA